MRREIAKEQRVKVSNREGIANQTGPESCVAHREVRDEALTGEPAGQGVSPAPPPASRAGSGGAARGVSSNLRVVGDGEVSEVLKKRHSF